MSYNLSNVPLHPNVVINNAGGRSFEVDKWERLLRFLTIGSESGTYYVGENNLTVENASNIVALAIEDQQRLVDTIVAVSTQGLAAKNDHAILGLAIATQGSNPSIAYNAVRKVCRNGTHIMQFVDFIKQTRGTGRGFRKTVSNWFMNMPDDKLAYQAIKYRQRNGWTLRDLLRLSHPKTDNETTKAVFDWICRGTVVDSLPKQILAFEEAKKASVGRIIELVREHNLPWEAIPTDYLKNIYIWEALTESIGTTALIRNLGKLSSIGFFDFPSNTGKVVKQLTDESLIRKDRIHPINVYLALRTYLNGRGDKGKLSWTVNTKVANALEETFYISFKNAEPTNKRMLVSVDVSGSMHASVNGSTNLSAKELAATLALYYRKLEPNADICWFADRADFVDLSRESSISQATKLFSRWSGGTDLGAPIELALNSGKSYDAIILITDDETWLNERSTNNWWSSKTPTTTRPQERFAKYRKDINRETKLICLSTTSSAIETVDRNDRNQFGTAGFNSAVPMLVANFLNS